MRGRRLAREVAALTLQLERPRFLRLVAEILVHDRRQERDGTRCACCKSRDAEIVERRQVDDLIVDTFTGERIRATDRAPAEWDKLCEVAARHDVPIRCSRRTLGMLTDVSDCHLFASGGHRAQKTTTGLGWMALQWMQRGGNECRFWLVARTDEDAFRLLEKLFKGTGESPPVLPAWLITRSPPTASSRDLLTRLVDGSLLDLRSFDNDPGAKRLKSDAIVAALVDEAAHLPSPSSLAALRGRCVDVEGGGRLWLASTPRPSHFLKAEVVDKAIEFAGLRPEDERKRTGVHEGAAWRFEALSMRDNPWIPLTNIERDMRTVDMTRAENRRDYLGEWVESEGLCWTDFDDKRHEVVHEARDVALLSAEFLASVGAAGHVPITARRVKALFGKPNPHYRPARASNPRFIIGQDVNVSPMQSCLLQFTAPADAIDDRERWHVWVLDCVTSPHSNTLEHARRLVSTEIARALDPLGTTSPIKGCGVICDATSLGKMDPHASRHGQTGSLAETFGRLDLDVRAPMYRRSSTGPGHTNGERPPYFLLIHRMLAENRIHVFSRAGALLHAFHSQLVEPDGTCPIDSRRGYWDQVMGPMDAFRYALYAAMNAGSPDPVEIPTLQFPGG